MKKFANILFSVALAMQALASAQTPAPAVRHSKNTKPQAGEAPRKKFVLDVVQTAVALPQPDPQDRLRVLNSAANVISPIDHKMAQRFAKEGIRIEAELVNSGQTPAVSMLATGIVDCPAAAQFAESISPTAVVQAEQSLIGAISECPKEALVPAQRKLETALNQGIVAPRGLLALMERVGAKSAWSQSAFEKMFSSLPADAAASASEAPNYAAMYERMAPELNPDIAKSTGLKLLIWLGKLPDSGERTVAINITTDSFKHTVGQKAYEEALASDVMARQAANLAGGQGQISHPEEESVSVLEAMNNTGTDQTEALRKMPATLRAKTAAADGYATGSEGNTKMADRYFDIAYAALEEVWSNRADNAVNAPAVLEEVNEAAAQVNPVTALQRAQKLPDPSAQAISMLAVARVVAGQQ
ncbi:hypothetical protein Acid345_1893 [Candidatus Koribacter versatilis Ellin345]|uniref:Uncharacterized protein n=1 Tax=Koribacter versatilis (strain Ellin345) TaxID=204669 RepID=Q1IQF6_KORVE|nr:hypothetical protein [Candidatus Koribacter versatilis]ABF40894.1 hypothetical protein Acid345_1893 [Candidatus Koribacter versatilis Ellin345]